MTLRKLYATGFLAVYFTVKSPESQTKSYNGRAFLFDCQFQLHAEVCQAL